MPFTLDCFYFNTSSFPLECIIDSEFFSYRKSATKSHFIVNKTL